MATDHLYYIRPCEPEAWHWCGPGDKAQRIQQVADEMGMTSVDRDCYRVHLQVFCGARKQVSYGWDLER